MAIVPIKPPKRVIIGVKDKFASEGDIVNLQSSLNQLPPDVIKVTRFSSAVAAQSGKMMLLVDVTVETAGQYEAQVKKAIAAGGFTVR